MHMTSKDRVFPALLWGALLVTAGMSAWIIVAVDDDEGSTLSSFSSAYELDEYLHDMSDGSAFGRLSSPSSPGSQPVAYEDGTEESSYSSTNVQVQGVDEGDMVKTDGDYVYIASYENVTILDAVPASDMTIVATIPAASLVAEADDVETSVSIHGLLLYQDRLAVIATVSFWSYESDDIDSVEWMTEHSTMTVVAVFDVADPVAPEHVDTMGISGHYITSRAVDGCVYLVTNHYVWAYEEEYILPIMGTGATSEEVDARDVLYDPTAADASSFTNVLAVDTMTMDSAFISLLTGYSSTVYMSEEHLYLTYQKWTGDIVTEDGAVEPEDTDTAMTTVHKISTDGTSMEAVASGTVRGWLLNQFSMDERDGYLRLATTTSWEDRENAVYVLDADLDIVGALEGLAPRESIYSTRFIGDRLYMVTFLQTDPLFVIDLSDPTDPRTLGELEMPGFSTYLHPVGEDLLLGVGMENWTLKVALYDVSDPGSPVELGKYIGDDQYTYSEALYDHKAFLFDQASGRLVLPVSTSGWDTVDGTYSYWQGFMVFSVDDSDGVSYIGEVIHDSPCTRSLIIGDVLYTVSDEDVKANDLMSLDGLASVQYGESSYYYDFPAI